MVRRVLNRSEDGSCLRSGPPFPRDDTAFPIPPSCRLRCFEQALDRETLIRRP